MPKEMPKSSKKDEYYLFGLKLIVIDGGFGLKKHKKKKPQNK